MKHKIMSIVHHNLQTNNNHSFHVCLYSTLKRSMLKGPLIMVNIKKNYLNYHAVGTTGHVHLLESLEKA